MVTMLHEAFFILCLFGFVVFGLMGATDALAKRGQRRARAKSRKWGE